MGSSKVELSGGVYFGEDPNDALSNFQMEMIGSFLINHMVTKVVGLYSDTHREVFLITSDIRHDVADFIKIISKGGHFRFKGTQQQFNKIWDMAYNNRKYAFSIDTIQSLELPLIKY